MIYGSYYCLLIDCYILKTIDLPKSIATGGIIFSNVLVERFHFFF